MVDQDKFEMDEEGNLVITKLYGDREKIKLNRNQLSNLKSFYQEWLGKEGKRWARWKC